MDILQSAMFVKYLSTQMTRKFYVMSKMTIFKYLRRIHEYIW